MAKCSFKVRDCTALKQGRQSPRRKVRAVTQALIASRYYRCECVRQCKMCVPLLYEKRPPTERWSASCRTWESSVIPCAKSRVFDVYCCDECSSSACVVLGCMRGNGIDDENRQPADDNAPTPASKVLLQTCLPNTPSHYMTIRFVEVEFCTVSFTICIPIIAPIQANEIFAFLDIGATVLIYRAQ